MKIYLMRHGETKWNKRSKLQGQVDIPLAPKGIEQAEMTSEGMKDIPFDHIFSSPLKRAYKTAQVVRRDRPIEIVRDDRLKEMSFGTSEGKIIGKIHLFSLIHPENTLHTLQDGNVPDQDGISDNEPLPDSPLFSQ